MTGLAQVFILSFIIIVLMIFFYILYNYAINEFKKNYRDAKIKTGLELIDYTKEHLSQLNTIIMTKNITEQNNTIPEIIKEIETDIELLKKFIENI